MPRASNNEPLAYIVASWTTLQIPLARTIEAENTEDGKHWLSLMHCHTPGGRPGFLRAVFGRVKEDPETVWFVTAWQDREVLDEFEQSEAYTSQRSEFAKLSTAPLRTQHQNINGDFYTSLSDHTAITDAYFPSSTPDALRQEAEKVRGMVYFMAPGLSKPMAYTRRGDRGWIQETADYEGQEAVVLRFLDYWKSEESEKEFKSNQGIATGGGPPESGGGRILSLYALFVEKLMEAGMVGIRVLHCKFSEIPVIFIGDDTFDSDEE